jgi:hypothetical protein
VIRSHGGEAKKLRSALRTADSLAFRKAAGPLSAGKAGEAEISIEFSFVSDFRGDEWLSRNRLLTFSRIGMTRAAQWPGFQKEWNYTYRNYLRISAESEKRIDFMYLPMNNGSLRKCSGYQRL